MHHATMLPRHTRRAFCFLALGTCAALLLPCSCMASIAQGIGKPVSDEALKAEFAGMCAGAEQMLAGLRPASAMRAWPGRPEVQACAGVRVWRAAQG